MWDDVVMNSKEFEMTWGDEELEGTSLRYLYCKAQLGDVCMCRDCFHNGCCEECEMYKNTVRKYDAEISEKKDLMSDQEKVDLYKKSYSDDALRHVCDHYFAWDIKKVANLCGSFQANKVLEPIVRYLNTNLDGYVCPAFGFADSGEVPKISKKYMKELGRLPWYDNHDKEFRLIQTNAFGGFLENLKGKEEGVTVTYEVLDPCEEVLTFALHAHDRAITKWYTVSRLGFHCSSKPAFRIIMNGYLYSSVREAGCRLLQFKGQGTILSRMLVRYNTVWYITICCPNPITKRKKWNGNAFSVAMSPFVFHNNRCVRYCMKDEVQVRGLYHSLLLQRLGFSFGGNCWECVYDDALKRSVTFQAWKRRALRGNLDNG